MRTYTKGALALLLSLGLVSSAFAQILPESNQETLKRVIDDLPAKGMTFEMRKPAAPEDKRFEVCGEYFYTGLFPSRRGGTIRRIMFNFFPVGYKDGIVLAEPQVELKNLQLRLVERLKVPRVKMLRTSGAKEAWFEVQVTSADLRRSPCLNEVRRVK